MPAQGKRPADNYSPLYFLTSLGAGALSVMLQFFVNKGLTEAGLIDKFSVAYWGVTAIALATQFLMIALVLRLNRQHFGKPDESVVVPAE